MSIYKNQTLLTITLDTSLTDLSTATTLKILYRKPSGADGFWAGSLSGVSSIEYSILSGDLDESGSWQLQAQADYSGNIGNGGIVHMIVKEPLPGV